MNSHSNSKEKGSPYLIYCWGILGKRCVSHPPAMNSMRKSMWHTQINTEMARHSTRPIHSRPYAL